MLGASEDDFERVLIGNLGSPWRAEVDRSGRIHPVDGSRTTGVRVAADDRWHDPSVEPSVRTRRVQGTPVVETRVRIPNGDLVQRVWSTIVAEGITVVEFHNDSPLPVAVAIDQPGVLTGPTPTTTVPDGIDMPSDSVVLPLGHQATVRIGIPHSGQTGQLLPADLPAAEDVVAGWRAIIDRAGRFELPAGAIGDAAADRCTALRCDWLLGDRSDPIDEPIEALIECDHLVRMGERVDDLIPIVADAVAVAARRRLPGLGAGLDAAARVLTAGGEQRALIDLDRMVSRLDLDDSLPVGRSSLVVALERRLAQVVDQRVALLPTGLPEDWNLQNFEVFGLPVGRDSTVSFAIRWHGRRPAVIWERVGHPAPLVAPSMDPAWIGDADRGEFLWEYEAPAPEVS